MTEMRANWKPLENRLGPARCAGFMYMGRLNGIHQYKHGLSRRYLNLRDDGRAFRQLDRGRFEEIPFSEALAWVAEPLAAMGETLDFSFSVLSRIEPFVAENGSVLIGRGAIRATVGTNGS